MGLIIPWSWVRYPPAPPQFRKFMETYGQEMGFSITQVAMRAGHDPSIAAKHYSGRVAETDRALANAVASLLAPPNEPSKE